MNVNKGLGIAVIVLSAGCYLLFHWATELQDKTNDLESVIREKDSEIEYRRTREGRIVASKDAAELRAQEIANNYPKIVDELKKDFDIKIKNLKAYIRSEVGAQGQGTGEITNHYHLSDSTRRFREFTMDDGYLSFRTTLYDTAVQAPYQYTYSDTITTVIHGKRKWILGNERLYSSSMLRNPNARVTGMTNIMVDSHRDKRWCLSVGASYDPFSNSVRPGVNFGYALFKF